MDSSRESAGLSGRRLGRDWSYLLVALMMVVFGLALSREVIPAWHELRAIEHRRAVLKQQVSAAVTRKALLMENIDAFDDPYYLAWHLRQHYGYRQNSK